MPFSFDVEPAEVHLDRSPLVRTLCQVRFSATPELVDDDSERQLAQLVSDDYPVRGSAEGVPLAIPGLEPSPREVFRTFEGADGVWKLTLSRDFLALETQGYGSRSEFVQRIRDALSAVAQVRRPPRVTRVGIRYTNRIQDPVNLGDLVNPAVLGWLRDLDDDKLLENQVVQVVLRHPTDDSKVLVQSLFLPPNVMFDVSISGVPDRAWVLDIDAFAEMTQPFDEQALTNRVETLASHAYQVFHWSVKDEFREKFRN